MNWMLMNGSSEIAWFASPTSGTIEAFGETVIEVVAPTRGLSARQSPYVASFELHSDDVCVCRSRSVKMSIELVVAADTDASNSIVQIIDPANATADGELVFHIIPVRHAHAFPFVCVDAINFLTSRCTICDVPRRRLTTRACSSRTLSTFSSRRS